MAAVPPASAVPTTAAPADLWSRERAAPQGADRAIAAGSGGAHGGFAWAAAGDGEGGRAPLPGASHGNHGGRTLGSVVPAAGSSEAVSPSRVNVVTMPSPAASQEGTIGVEAERG
mmetsp:Transcript_53796/g.162742  ORF Transcript_53796/g.162742 Transcript_53796/m.162742 type:complete len:115 (-) Transcript_53796:133-477(-)